MESETVSPLQHRVATCLHRFYNDLVVSGAKTFLGVPAPPLPEAVILKMVASKTDEELTVVLHQTIDTCYAILGTNSTEYRRSGDHNGADGDGEVNPGEVACADNGDTPENPDN